MSIKEHLEPWIQKISLVCSIRATHACPARCLYLWSFCFLGVCFSYLPPAGFHAHESAGAINSGCSQSAHHLILRRSGCTKTDLRSEPSTICVATTSWRHHCVQYLTCVYMRPRFIYSLIFTGLSHLMGEWMFRLLFFLKLFSAVEWSDDCNAKLCLNPLQKWDHRETCLAAYWTP